VNVYDLWLQVVLCDIWRCGPGYGFGVRLYNDCSSRNVRVDYRGRVLADDETSNPFRKYIMLIILYRYSYFYSHAVVIAFRRPLKYTLFIGVMNASLGFDCDIGTITIYDYKGRQVIEIIIYTRVWAVKRKNNGLAFRSQEGGLAAAGIIAEAKTPRSWACYTNIIMYSILGHLSGTTTDEFARLWRIFSASDHGSFVLSCPGRQRRGSDGRETIMIHIIITLDYNNVKRCRNAPYNYNLTDFFFSRWHRYDDIITHTFCCTHIL